jgi:hypothetical protein
MLKDRVVLGLVVLLLLFAGCTTTPTSAPLTTGTQLPLPSATPIILTPTTQATAAPASIETPVANMPTATNTSTQPSASNSILSGYLDDRSTPSGLMLSYVNALSRREYLRAYTYWEYPQQELGSYDQYQQGYQDTTSVEVTLGQVNGDILLSQGDVDYVYSVPAVLVTQTNTGQTQTFVGCYVMHLSSPSGQTAPPFQPMGVRSATVEEVDNSTDHNSLLAGACPSIGSSPAPVSTTDPDTIASSNYLDDRSSAVDVLSSLFNAINRREYARAYSYWQDPGNNPDLASFSQFEQGYQETASVEATFGEITSDVGAGQIRFRVPVTLVAQTTTGETQYFVGCYQLHLGQPATQVMPPFQPLAIERAVMQEVASQPEAAIQMDNVCVNMQ